MKDIESITIDDCREFYKTYYAPNNATLVLVGDFEESPTLALVEKAYGPIARQPIAEEHTVVEPTQLAPRRAEFKKAVAAERLQIGWHAAGAGDLDHSALELVAEILTGGSSSRLHRELVVEKEIAIAVSASVAPFRDPGLFEMSVSMVRGHEVEEAEALIETALIALANDGPSTAELEGARARLLTRFWVALRPQNGKAEGLGQAEITLGDYRRAFEPPQRFAALDADAVRRAVGMYLVPAHRTTVVARPRKKGTKE